MPEGTRPAEEGTAAVDAAAAATEVRFSMPSPIGTLAVDLVGVKVTGLRIKPTRRQLSAYTPFVELEDDSEFLEELFGRISEYFAGVRRRLEVEWDLEPCGVSGFARRVLKETAKIPYGRTRTYRDIAAASGQPDAYRLVLATLIENPIPIVIPCHRVTTNKSGIGSYIGGKSAKRWLLEMEKRSAKELAAAAAAVT
ncbi:MAG TPA: methylated-DNA--[protein]-cysteine S-methyltransferase [Thermoanaerobaculia bacterium]|nr:methylated-DNA--[protein]-cysteine S-methyltransferase [Thermoanaerobaculia bacterium]